MAEIWKLNIREALFVQIVEDLELITPMMLKIVHNVMDKVLLCKHSVSVLGLYNNSKLSAPNVVVKVKSKHLYAISAELKRQCKR